MSRGLDTLTALVAEVSDTYASRNAIRRDDDWYLLKLQEELGELTAEYLKTTGRGRKKGAEAPAIRQALEDEAADVLATLLLFRPQERHRSGCSTGTKVVSVSGTQRLRPC